ncbi:PepSY domain-containing protein [Micromonospora endolithica]|uniref:PepSY domain-containing protein n=1 Tax=Micromonospora endolithica TaxID=230091 RepID=A0A3A9ZHU0_9ACTN|nr:PepSY domain-containing protein [Micromonospora endolithica]RKN47941.1 hypothetical protein D7223_13460 [Micromonospora endolithica]TWJ21426.1 peptidase YpeB-like protein [Micromonospora endolithica]
MKRNSLLLASVGGAAVLAVAGVAIGVTAADSGTAGATRLTAATTAPTTAATPDDSPSGTPATAGTPSGTPTSAGPSATGSTPATGGGAVSEQRAGEIALARAGGGRIVEIEAEDEDGRSVWDVEIVAGQTEHEIEVDRENGAVVKAEQEPVDDDDDKDDDDSDD